MEEHPTHESSAILGLSLLKGEQPVLDSTGMDM